MPNSDPSTHSEQQVRPTPGIRPWEFTVLSSSFTVVAFVVGILDYLDAGDPLTRWLVLPLIFLSAIACVWVFELRASITHRSDLAILFLIPIAVAVIMSSGYYVYSYQRIDAAYIAPSFRRWFRPLPTTSTYGTNAKVWESRIYETANGICPAYFLRLKLQMYGTQSQYDSDAGWILGNLRGFDASQYKALHFSVRGDRGGEVFGVSLKDMQNAEAKIPDVSSFVKGGHGVTDTWQEVEIPLLEFRDRQIDLLSLDNLSLFVDAKVASIRVIWFDVANIRLEKQPNAP